MYFNSVTVDDAWFRGERSMCEYFRDREQRGCMESIEELSVCDEMMIYLFVEELLKRV